jgi:hypothetical protein
MLRDDYTRMAIETASVTAGLAGASHVLNLLKGITSTIKAIGKAELIHDVIELQSCILEMQEKHGEVWAENQTLKQTTKKLREDAELAEKMIWPGSVYEIVGAGSRNGIYCGTCYDVELKFVRLHKEEHGNDWRWFCKNCGMNFPR